VRKLAVALGVLASLAILVHAARQQQASRLPAVAPTPASTAEPEAPEPRAEAPRLVRDPFRYLEEQTPPRESVGAERRAPLPEPAPTPEPALKLLGFVRRKGAVHAVLRHREDVAIAGQGDEVGGFRILSVDEDQGVLLRAPSGEETRLSPDRK
jgi:hypothetical protein